jgi:anti-sigma regulatory factor (Ser/Thr protein kinase)
MRDFRPAGRWTLPDDFASAGEARRHLRETLPHHAVLEDLELVVSELVANAVEHGVGPITVALDRAPGVLRLEVRSATGSSEPRVLPATTEAGGGRGLALVAALADAWGWDVEAGQTGVWAEFTDA